MQDDKKTDRVEDVHMPARRALFQSGTAAAASLLLGGAVAAALAGCGDDDSTPNGAAAGKGGAGGSAGKAAASGSGGKAGAAGSAGAAGTSAATDADIGPLNALLKAEYSALAAYSAGADIIGKAPDSDPLFALKDVIVGIAVDFRSQHALHAEALVDAIVTLNGTPASQADVAADFKAPAALVANPTITNVLKFAAGAERDATVAYNQVLAGLESAKLRFLASAIEGDESQHFIVLAALILGLAAPTSKLDQSKVGDVVPEAFVTTVGQTDGLDKSPPDYFA
jgi:bacterioferritin (cytochrome b1)